MWGWSLDYKVLISNRALEFLNSLTEKSQKIVKDKLEILYEDPYPGKRGDKKILSLPDYELYRLHISLLPYSTGYTVKK